MSKVEMLGAVMQEFDLHKLAYLGSDDEFGPALIAEIGDHGLEAPMDGEADVAFIDDYPPEPYDGIAAVFQKVREGGFIMGSKYDHDHIEVQNAVARAFNLAFVQVGPGNVWAVRR